MDWALRVGVLAVAFFLLWLLQRRTANASWADAGWAVGTGAVLAWGLAAGDGDPGRRGLALSLAVIWAARLGGHLVLRALDGREDGRFHDLRQKWGPAAQRNFLRYFLAQVPLVLLFALPAVALADDPRPLGARDLAGGLVALAGLVGTAAADRQLARHRESAPDEVCRTGLWAWSRHPNYFFEWVFWCAWPFLAPLSPVGALALVPPIVLYVLLTRVTGIPPAERRAVRRRGDAYRRYQSMTSAFFPKPPARSPETLT
jgi:steroid 5-alpha reductase family enzyme